MSIDDTEYDRGHDRQDEAVVVAVIGNSRNE